MTTDVMVLYRIKDDEKRHFKMFQINTMQF